MTKLCVTPPPPVSCARCYVVDAAPARAASMKLEGVTTPNCARLLIDDHVADLRFKRGRLDPQIVYLGGGVNLFLGPGWTWDPPPGSAPVFGG